MKELVEKQIESKTVFEGRILKMVYDTVILPNGKHASREVVRHPGAVAVVPVTDDGRVVLVRQYRHAAGKVLLEIPAGKLDNGESPEDCVLRELAEETGYMAGKINKLTAMYTAPGFTDEIIHIYFASGLSPTEKIPDEDEFINVEFYTPQQVKMMIADGTICDAKSIVGLLLSGI